MRPMLGTFREKIVKWGTQLLFGILLLSFVGWGIGDYLGYSAGSRNLSVATVGNTSISTRDFQTVMQQQMTRMRQVLGDNFGAEQARAMGIEDNVLQSMIQEALFVEGARRLGLVVDDSVVAHEIRTDRQFRSASGGFDRMQFENTLRQMGYTEGAYVAELKKDLLRTQYLSPLAIGRAAPSSLVETLYRYRNERRVAQVVVLPHTVIKDVPEPTQADLEKYHADNAPRFTAPEYRAFTVIRMRPSDIVGEIEVPEARIREYYEDHLNEFSQPERRTIQQILFNDEESARAAYARVEKGEDFAAVAKDTAGVSGDGLTLGTLAKEEIPIPELADEAIMLQPGMVSKPVQSPIGWHLLKVTEIRRATVRSLDETKEEVRKRIANEMASDTLYKLSTRFEDELGGGASAEEAAKRLKLNVLKFDAIDRNGRDPEGNGGEGLSPEIVRAAYDTQQGGESPLGELTGGEGGYFMVHVDKVTPQALKPLDQIKDEVAAAWKADERAKRAEVLAKQMLDDIKGGKLLKDVAEANGAQILTTSPFTRTREGLNVQIPGAILSALFKSPPGTPEMAQAADVHVIALVSDVVAADPAKDADGIARLKDELAGALASDISLGLANALRDKLSVTIDRAAVNSAF
jgi:peptidyl-prolyl cis-trans isomerase D